MGDSFRMKDGRILPPQTPGLGISLNEETRRRFPFVPGSGEFNSVPGKMLTG
jgi:L-alanine-DL-glutamate epimerase-like enolase superfamily enzyme